MAGENHASGPLTMRQEIMAERGAVVNQPSATRPWMVPASPGKAATPMAKSPEMPNRIENSLLPNEKWISTELMKLNRPIAKVEALKSIAEGCIGETWGGTVEAKSERSLARML